MLSQAKAMVINMYAFFEGIVDTILPDRVYLNVNGVGYELVCSAKTLDSLKTGEKARLYAHYAVSQDAAALYGFAAQREKAMFLRLISVSRVGGKAAISALGVLTAEELAAAIVTENVALLANAPGVGKKTAQRIILELKEKIGKEQPNAPLQAGEAVSENIASEAAAALMALGYNPAAAASAVASVSGNTVQEVLTAALRQLSR